MKVMKVKAPPTGLAALVQAAAQEAGFPVVGVLQNRAVRRGGGIFADDGAVVTAAHVEVAVDHEDGSSVVWVTDEMLSVLERTKQNAINRVKEGMGNPGDSDLVSLIDNVLSYVVGNE
jgi:hypothetical protein